MQSIAERDFGTPESRPPQQVTLKIDGQRGHGAGGHLGHARRRARRALQIPKLCATDSSRRSAPAGCAWCRSRAGRAIPASCTTPVADGMKVTTQNDKLAQLRRGVMELYISDHPLDCLTCPANGHCELQDMAGAVGLREVRYGYAGANHLHAPKDESNPYFTFDPEQVHRLLALRARLRREAGHAGADDPGPRLRLEGGGEPGRVVPRLRMRLLRRLRAGLPDRDAVGEVADQAGPGRAQRRDHLRLLRRRLLVPRRDARRGSRAHGAEQGRPRQPRPRLRQGTLCHRLRDASGPHHQADDPRQRSPIRGAK